MYNDSVYRLLRSGGGEGVVHKSLESNRIVCNQSNPNIGGSRASDGLHRRTIEGRTGSRPHRALKGEILYDPAVTYPICEHHCVKVEMPV